MVNLNIILTVIIISIILIILILLTLNYFNKIENFREINGKYGYICSYNSDCTPVENTLCVTDDGYSVYACGYTFGLSNKVSVPTEIGLIETVPITNFNQITIKDINVGESFTRILTNEGDVLFSGDDILNTSSIFTKLSHTQIKQGNIKKIFNNAPDMTSENNVFFCLTYDDEVYCCGKNTNGQLGLGDTDDRDVLELLPLSSFDNKKIRDVCIGPGFTIFLTEDDELYSCGLNTSGQLGLGDQTDRDAPIKISPATYSSKKIKSIYCGISFTFIITEDGDVYSTGGGYGAGFEGIHDTRYNPPWRLGPARTNFENILTSANIESIYTKSDYTIFMSENDTVYMCGKKFPRHYDDYNVRRGDVYYTPQNWWEVGSDVAVRSIVIFGTGMVATYHIITREGNYITNHHTVGRGGSGNNSRSGLNAVIAMGIGSFGYGTSRIVSRDGKIWDSGPKREQGTGRYFKSTEEVGDIGKNIERVYKTSGDHYIVQAVDGSLYAIGNNSNGQLGLGNTVDASTLTEVTSIQNLFNYVIVPQDFIFKKISSKVNTSLFLTEEGTVYGCGLNNNGQLGTGDMVDKHGLIMLGKTINTAETLSNIKQVSAYLNHTIILTEEGNLYACGLNDYGQLGLYGFKETSGEKNFIQLPISNVVKISCGEDNLYILKDDDYVYVCGRNDYGQLGLGHQNNIDKPTKIKSDNLGNSFGNIKDISAKSGSCLFLTRNGDVYGCGLNDHGQLGLSDTIDRKLPTKNPRLFRIKNIFMGEMCSFYINETGTAYSCGRNSNGELGIGNDLGNKDYTHTVISPGIPFIDISCGSKFNMFLDENGNVYSCGTATTDEGTGSRLGFDDTNNINTPNMINLAGAVITKIYCGSNHSLFLTDELTVYGCGLNNKGQLGIDSTYSNMAVPIPGLSNIETITCGLEYSFFVNNVDTIYSCGLNNQGQLGLGDQTDRDAPTPIDLFNLIEYINGIKDVEVGVNECFFLKEDGSVYVTIDKLPRPMSYLTDQNIKQISVGDDYNMTDNGSKLFLTEDGYVYSLGLNNYGQLGLGDQTDRDAPIKIQYDNLDNDFGNIKKIICKGTFSMFLTKEGTVYATGSGPIGLGYAVTKPTIIPFISNIKDISASKGHSLFLTEDGYVYGCGNNNYGQLASAQSDAIIPRKLNMMNITAISCGKNHSLFVTKFDETYSCGQNSQGQLGLGDNTNRQGPAICNIIDVKNVYAGDTSSFFLKVADV